MIDGLVATGQALAIIPDPHPYLWRFEQNIHGYVRGICVFDRVGQAFPHNLQGMDLFIWRQGLGRQIVLQPNRLTQPLGKFFNGLLQGSSKIRRVQLQPERRQQLPQLAIGTVQAGTEFVENRLVSFFVARRRC